ncbi:glycosyltransferase [Mesorhizobium australicum]|uniref:glycosyltransferase n=1 Tax=Mesorhizobium australicum TaxID=536018 RepID=UPI00333A04B2
MLFTAKKWLRGPNRIDKVQSAERHDVDPVTVAVVQGLQESPIAARPDTKAVGRARRQVNSLREMAELPDTLSYLLGEIARFPNEERLQQIAAQALERFQDPRAFAVWRGIDSRFPNSRHAYVRLLRWTIRLGGTDAGRNIHAERYPEEPKQSEGMFVFARALIELKDFEEAEQALSKITQMGDVSEAILLDVAKLYLSINQPLRAREIVNASQDRFGPSVKNLSVASQVDANISALERAVESSSGADNDPQEFLIEHVFNEAKRLRPSAQTDNKGFLGHLILVNGGLGSGGAERQLTNTALAIKSAIEGGRLFNGHDVIGPVQILCRSLNSRSGSDFFAPLMSQAGFNVHQYVEFEKFAGRPGWSCLREVIHCLPYLPFPMREGLVQAADVLRQASPDVIHIWQDGSVLALGLAALFANVPRIVLGVRTLPPVDRAERNKPEYKIVYRLLLSAPGVVIVSNSLAAAKRYEEWLDLPRGTVRIIPNGLEPLSLAADEATLAMARAFSKNNPRDCFTVGSAMRFDNNKRPLEWLDIAAAFASSRPDVRFIMVGDGPLHSAAMSHARKLGIEDRVLFTGRSQHVGFWLSQMDVFLLLSRHEGLPNVLIEAQYSGLPVVATPAGGSGETFDNGRTGTLLPSIERVDPKEVAKVLDSWCRPLSERELLAKQIREYATERFSIDSMLALTLEAYLN